MKKSLRTVAALIMTLAVLCCAAGCKTKEKRVKVKAADLMEDVKANPGSFLTRPFVYMLIDTEANIPLFIGVMNDPEK